MTIPLNQSPVNTQTGHDLPIVADQQIVADLHCHTLASTHAYSTITELANAAAECGLCAVACTDHGIGLPDAPHLWHFLNLRALPRAIAGVRILHGVEANVMDFTGRLDMPVEMLERLDIVIASMHMGLLPAGTVEECTNAWLAVAENPLVDIIGHSGTPCYAYDYERVIPVFGQYGKIVEINENSFGAREGSAENCRRIAQLCKQHHVRVVVNSDTHYHTTVGQVPVCMEMLREIGYPSADIINGSRETFAAFLTKKGLSL